MKTFFSLLLIFTAFTAQSQPKTIELDKSPMDMSYWPNNYPLLKMNGKAKDMPVARVVYSRPLKNGRAIFGGTLKYNEIWRLGANEATEIEFFTNVTIAGKPIGKGRYTLYCIPAETKWTLILSKDNYAWGNYTYDSKKDVLRTDLTIEKTANPTEAFTMYFDETKTGANLLMLWDNVQTALPISVAAEEKK